MAKISIYQVFTRLFGNANVNMHMNGSLEQNGVGKMSDFSDKALQAVKDLGITHIWYTGIIEHASCESYPEYNILSQHASIVKGRAGSPYAITDYYDVNPYLADVIPNRMAEFEALIKRTHKNGLKAIIDFVPNHVARQYHSDVYPDKNFGINDDMSVAFSPKNDFYYLPNEELHLAEGMGTFYEGRPKENYHEFPAKATGNDQFHAYPTLNDWYETVKLNYGVDYPNGRQKHFDPIPPLWDKMVAILEFWCGKNVDAIRCDMAEMVPVEFWQYAIAKIKNAYPKVIFIAEVYNPSEYANYLSLGGFDYLYDKVGLYDCLRNIICYDSPASEITKAWQNLGGIDAKMLSFLENHDEHRIASEQFAKNAFFALPAMVVSATLNTGPVMTYFGQEFGEPAKGATGYSGDDGKTTIFDFYTVPEFQKWRNNGSFDGGKLSGKQKELRKAYKELLSFCLASEAISNGKFYDLMWANNFEGGPDTRYIYAYLRYTKDDKLLVLVNFNKYHSQNFRLKIPEHALSELHLDHEQSITLQDVLLHKIGGEISAIQFANQGMSLSLEPLNYLIFKLK